MTDDDAPAPAPDRGLELLRAVWALDHELARKSKRMAREFGVTGTQRFVLRLAAERPGIAAGELAAILHLHASTLTGVLDRLRRRGLLERRADPADGRKSRFHVSVRGRRLARWREGTDEACAREVLTRGNAGDVDATVRVLRAMTALLERDEC